MVCRRDLGPDRGPVDVPVPRRGQQRTDSRLLAIGKPRSRSGEAFLKRALANPDNKPLHVLSRDGLRSYPAAVRELQRLGHVHRGCRQRTRRYCNNRIESDHRHIKRRLRAMQGPRTAATARRVIQGIEAAQMIRKGQVLGCWGLRVLTSPVRPGHSGRYSA